MSTQEVVARCLLFIEALSSIGFYNYQRVFAQRVVESVLCRDGDIVTGLWSRQSGKTETIADVGIGLGVMLPKLAESFPDDERFRSFTRGFWVGIFAPILDQATTCYNRMREKVEKESAKQILNDDEVRIQVTQNRGDTIAFSNGSYVRARSASEDSQIEGGTYHLIILEEAQKLSRSKVNKEISPMLASTNGTMVKIGTAYMSKGGFHSSINTNMDTWKAGGKRNHFEFPYDLVIKEKRLKYEQEKAESGSGDTFHLNYEAWITKEIRRLGGTDSDEFKMNFRLLWQETRLSAVRGVQFNAAAMDGEAGRRLFEIGFKAPANWPLVAGLDIGKSNDSTVLTIGAVNPDPIYQNDGFALRVPTEEDEDKHGEKKEQVFHEKWIVNWLELQGSFEGDEGQYATMLAFLQQYPGLKMMAVDSTGMGDPVCERLGVLLYGVNIIPYKLNLPSKHLLYKNYLTELHSSRVKYPGGPLTREMIEYTKFKQEHEDLDKTLIQNYTIVRHSDENGHDDYPDSAALMAWAEKEMWNVAELPEVEESSGGAFSQPTKGMGRSARYNRRR